MSRRSGKRSRSEHEPRSLTFWLGFLLLGVAIISVGIHRVSLEFRILRVAQAKAEALRLNRELRERAEKLQVELAAEIRGPEVGSLAAERYGMRFPQRSQVVRVQMTGRP